MRRIASLVLVLILALSVLPVSAQDKAATLDLRAAVQDGFVRLVFSGDPMPAATVTQEGGKTVSVKFALPVNVPNAGAATAAVTPATTIAASAADTLTITTGDLARYRTLTLGNRLFVDLFTKEAPVQGKAETPAPAPAPVAEAPVTTPASEEPPPAESLVAEDAPPAAALAPPAEVKTTLPAEPAPVVTPVSVAPETPAEPVKPFTGSAIITVGSTQGLALAAFVRSGYLWMVLSQEALTVPPMASGPDAAALGPIDAVQIDGGSAYRVKLPEGAYVRPEGAGLVWRLYIEGKKPSLRSVTADRDFSNTAEGPQVHIPLLNAISALRLPDPLIGDDLAVITVGRAENRLINSDSYVDFDLLPAIVGAVIRPKADGIRIAVLPTEVVISRQGGLRMTSSGPRVARPAATETAKTQTPAQATPVVQKAPAVPQIFSMKDWSLGGPRQYVYMRRSIDEKVATAPDNRKLPELLAGAKFMLAQGLPQEATGFMQMSLSFMPQLRESAEFQALNGAVLALMGETEQALAAFNAPGLENNHDITLWRAYTLARQGKLGDAQKMFPATGLTILGAYPARLQTLLLPLLIEAQLAFGDIERAESMVELYETASENTLDSDRDNAIAYFRGRLAQLQGDIAASSEYYRQASEGLDGPYPVRATLALVERGLSDKTISREDAIRKLERFRYGWRGDSLESKMLERLGLIYVTGGEQRRGLTILRDAATMAQDPAERQQLAAVMQKAFRELFSGKTREKMTPLESASVAAEFAELMPAGGEGEAITMTIADQMVAVDLLDRASDLIEPMVDRTEKLSDAIRYAQRAAAIRLLNDQPEDALKIIDVALNRPDAQAQKTFSQGDTKTFALLRAKAKAELGRTDEALAELAAIPEDSESLRLTADISWEAQRWPVAAHAFGRLVKLSNLNATRPPTRDQAQLVLNQALAYNLSGDTAQLETLRLGYSDIMRRSELNQPFQLVTRMAREAQLADRETLLKLVSEVNMFKDVLEAYKAAPAATATKAAPKQAEKPAAAAPAATPAPEAEKETRTN